MSKLNKLPVKNEVIHQLAVGESQNSIAGQSGVDQSTISRFAKKDEIRQLIEEKREKLVKEVLPDAFQNVKSLVKGMKDVPENDIKKLELCYKATRDTLKATGLFPSPQFAHNIYNDNRIQTQNNISPIIIKLIGNAALKQLQSAGEDEENSDIEKW